MAPTIDEITVGDPPEAWAAAGFAVDEDGTSRVGHVRIRLVGRDAGKRILGWSLRDVTPGSLDGGDVDGLPTTATAEPPCAPADHPNGVTHIDHVVLLTADLDRTTAALEATGLRALRTRATDTYGAPMLQRFFRAGEVILELIGPEQAGDGPTAFFGLAHTTADLDGLAEDLGPALGRIKDAVQEGRRIATLRHKELGLSVATAFMTPEPGSTPEPR